MALTNESFQCIEIYLTKILPHKHTHTHTYPRHYIENRREEKIQNKNINENDDDDGIMELVSTHYRRRPSSEGKKSVSQQHK